MKRLGLPTLGATLAVAFAATASGCLVERGYVRDEPSYPARLPPPRVVEEAPVERVYEARAEAGPGVEVEEDSFYDRLSPYGHWSYTPEYGRVWIPSGIATGWRPYTDGHWALTDWGWTYASDAPWGWAAYHYGSWGFGGGLGWYWIPGRVWSPAWVSWRYGGGYVAWAPLGPGGYYYGAQSPAWVAVREQHFTQPIRTVAIPVQRTAGIVAGATPQAGVTRPRPIASGGVLQGPPVARVSGAIGQRLTPVPVAKVLPRAGIGGGAISRAAEGSHSGARAGLPGTGRVGRSPGSGRVARPPSAGSSGDRWNRATRPSNRWGSPGGRQGSSGRYGPSAAPRTGGASRPGGATRSGGGTSGGAAPRSSAPSGGGGHSTSGRASGSGHNK